MSVLELIEVWMWLLNEFLQFLIQQTFKQMNLTRFICFNHRFKLDIEIYMKWIRVNIKPITFVSAFHWLFIFGHVLSFIFQYRLIKQSYPVYYHLTAYLSNDFVNSLWRVRVEYQTAKKRDSTQQRIAAVSCDGVGLIDLLLSVNLNGLAYSLMYVV